MEGCRLGVVAKAAVSQDFENGGATIEVLACLKESSKIFPRPGRCRRYGEFLTLEDDVVTDDRQESRHSIAKTFCCKTGIDTLRPLRRCSGLELSADNLIIARMKGYYLG